MRRAGRSTVYAPHFAAATSQPLATTAALRVLEDGGNAVDAAVTAAAVLNVVEPYMTGIGGDLFALVWSHEEGRLLGLDASGRAGGNVDTTALKAEGHTTVPARDARAVTVPGALAGWTALLERLGTMPLGRALAPAIDLARNGFPVTPVIARDWASVTDVLRDDPGAAATFLRDGRPPNVGDWFTLPDLGDTFAELARDGADTFYGGDLGRRLAGGLETLGGWVTLDDLATHRVRWVDALTMDYRGVTLHELPPSGQGIAALQMLGMLKHLDLSGSRHNSVAYLHTLVEAKKLAYADLAACVADPDHMHSSPQALLDPGYLAERAGQIHPYAALARTDPGSAATASDTVYLTVADAKGNMVSLINSIYQFFGSGLVVPGTGFALQNRGAGFTLEAGHPNVLAPGKRPLHTIIPAFATRNGAPWMSFGVMGGPMQPQGHVQVLLNMLQFGMNPQEALEAPRFRHLEGLRLAVEDLPTHVAAGLGRRGHEIVAPEGFAFGGAQAIVRLGRGWAAASDPRKDGMAAGG